MFEHPRNCPNWQEKCPGPPLTHRTRLNWPSEDSFDGAEAADLAGHAQRGPGAEYLTSWVSSAIPDSWLERSIAHAHSLH
jgi:hypothetical protein